MQIKKSVLFIAIIFFNTCNGQAKISEWRHYFNPKKAAHILTQQVASLDRKNVVRVKLLQQEVKAFRDERLGGNLQSYPVLATFLDKYKDFYEKEPEKAKHSVHTIATQLAYQRKQKEEQKKEEQFKKIAQEKFLAWQKEEARKDNVRRKREQDFLRKAAELENRRKRRITAWRHYLNKSKAVVLLQKAIREVDVRNMHHVSELKQELCAFREERLGGSLQAYPDLNSFLSRSFSFKEKKITPEPNKKNMCVKKEPEQKAFSCVQPKNIEKKTDLKERITPHAREAIKIADQFSQKIGGNFDTWVTQTFDF